MIKGWRSGSSLYGIILGISNKMPRLRKTNERWNKRKRSERLEEIRNNTSDTKERVLLYFQYGLNLTVYDEEIKKEILSKFEELYKKNSITNPITKAAVMLRNELYVKGRVESGIILEIYNLAPNIFSNNKIYLDE